MDTRTKELIAIGASVTAHCEPCLHYHIGKAQEAGVTAEDIKEAVHLGKAVRAGSTRNMDRVIADALEGAGAPADEPAAAPASCCGSSA